MKLIINSKAPDFSLDDVFDRKVDISDYLGRKVLLAFFRHAGCPFCNLRVHTLMKHHAGLKNSGLDMIFVFESMKRVILRSSFHREISPVPIISDPDKKLYTSYGLENNSVKALLSHLRSYVPAAIKAFQTKVPNHYMEGSESISTIPAEFLIDQTGVIRALHYSNSLTDRMSVDSIVDFAK